MANKLLQSALWYREKMGFSVIPVRQDKKPYIQWERYQTEKAEPDTITEWWGKWPNANVGIVTGSISGVTVIDVDTEEGRSAIEKLLPEGYMAPMVSSPRGGQHFYCKHEDGLRNLAGFLPGVDLRAEGGYIVAPPSTNGGGKAYNWQVSIANNSLNTIPNTILSLLYNTIDNTIYIRDAENDHKRPQENHRRLQVTTDDHKIFIPQGTRDEALFHAANCLIKGKMHPADIETFLTLIAQNCCNPPYPLDEIKAKVESAMGRVQRQNQNLTREVEEWVSTTNGHFTTTQIHNELQTTTKNEKKAVNMALLRMLDNGIVERVGNRAGTYRKIEKVTDVYDVCDLEVGEMLNIKLPFGLEEYVDCLERDIYAFFGLPNAGKTALMIECARLNMKDHQVYYWSSEIGRQNLAMRLAKATDIPKTEWKFKFSDELPNFVDIVQPDAVNIIDYIEVSDGNYYMIPGILAEIHKKLKKGVAFVALQKNPGTKFGVGGYQTLAKPSLAVSVEPDFPGAKMEVVKAKNYKEINPHGMITKFKIINGIKLKNDGWIIP
jgi:hypothetical protein